MGWARSNAARKGTAQVFDNSFTVPAITPATIDWERLVVIDFETFWNDDYTLRKLSTSEYVRDPRFKAQMVGIKIGSKPTKWYPATKIRAALRAIPWATHSFLGHHAQFDGLILWERYGISPLKIYDTLSMARALYSNDIGAGLDEVSLFTGGPGKIHDVLEKTKGVLNWPAALTNEVGPYCCRDVDETIRVFKHMLPAFPAEEIELIDHICRMFTEPVLGVDRPRVQKELEREIAEKKAIMLSFVPDADKAGIKLTKADIRALPVEEGESESSPDTLNVRRVKKLIGSAEGFANLLRREGIEPPVKVSPAYFKHRDESKKWTYAFSKTDLKFVELQEHPSPRVRALVEARLAVKSTTNETRAGRFLKASEDDAKLPVYLKYSAAHTHRLGGGNKMNMQNLKRGGELRLSILAPEGEELVIVDSGQIEARMNAWLWGQEDLLDDFRLADQGLDRDAYCKFGDVVYGREITKADKIERHVAKTCILGLGYQMGAPRLRNALALGANGGPQVFLSDDECLDIVRKYRRKNFRIKNGWDICQRIVEQMAAGVAGSYKCIAWDKETLYLPNGMTMHYPNLHDARIEKLVAAKLTSTPLEELDFDPDRPQFIYESKDNEKKIYGGLLCLAADTEVLTHLGWKRIVDVTTSDRLWDGAEWHRHSGVEFRGVKQTINFGGARMTPDHQVLVNEQWIEAQHTSHGEAASSCARHYGNATRDADRYAAGRQRREEDALGSRVRLRDGQDNASFGVLQGQGEVVRLQHEATPERSTDAARAQPPSAVPCVAQHDRALHASDAPGVEELRGPGDHSLRTLEGFPAVLRGHGADVQAGAHARTQEERRGLQQSELRLGHVQGAGEQPPATEEVYDLIDAGPRRRFTVRGTDGRPFIVHNCENIVQALARIVVMTQCLNIVKTRKFKRWVMSTHDEGVFTVKKGVGEKGYKLAHAAFSTAPSWALDLPLNADGGFDVFYSK